VTYDMSDSRVYSDAAEVIGVEWAQAIERMQVEGMRLHVV
jgi:hypothetical protein